MFDPDITGTFATNLNDEQKQLHAAQSEAVAANQQVLVLAAANEKLTERVGELERLLRAIQQDAKLGDDEYHVSMRLIMAIDEHIGLNAGEQVIVPNYAADNARLRELLQRWLIEVGEQGNMASDFVLWIDTEMALGRNGEGDL